MNNILTAFLIFLCFSTFGQQKSDTLYYNRFGDVTQSSDSAKYYRLTQEENKLYRISDYDVKTGLLSKTGSYKDPELKTREGEFVHYDETGKIITEKSNYTDGKLNGISQVYYATGELYYTERYVHGEKQADLLVYYKDGSLKRKEFLNPDGHGFRACYLPDGKETAYYEFMTPASFSNGEMAGLRKFLSENVQYPWEAVEKMIVGKVYVQFVVSKTGELKDVVLRRSVHPSLDKEALRVVKSMPKWKPGTLDGETVDSFFTLPITFNLN